MKVSKNIASVVLAGALTLGGCSGSIENADYDFNGTIGDAKVTFSRIDESPTETSYGDRLTLTIKKENSVIEYIDTGNDLEIDSVIINGREEYNKESVIGREVLKIAQEQFNSYLGKILAIKTEQALAKVREFSQPVTESVDHYSSGSE